MEMPEADGTPRGIAQRIEAGLSGPFDRAKYQSILLDRMFAVVDRLDGRMGSLPNREWLLQRLIGLDDSTLKVLVETQPWITAAVGGEEISVDSVFPQTKS